MVLIIIAAFILAAPFIIAAYLRKSTQHLRVAEDAWKSVEQHARVLLEDKHLDPRVGDVVETLIRRVGNGDMARRFLFALLFPRKGKALPPEAKATFNAMNEHQSDQFTRLLISALFFDSLFAHLLGPVLRRLIYWLAATAADKSAKLNKYEVAPVISVAGQYCRA